MIMDYENKYKEALAWIRSLYPTMKGAAREDAEHYFPELKESKDERIRKMIIYQMERWHEAALENNAVRDIKDSADAITWLEKQGKQKQNPYSGTSFEYNGNTWGLVVKDNNIEVLFNGETKVKILIDDIFNDANKNIVKPKFHKGDWIITNKKYTWYIDETPETTSYLYRLINQYGKVEVADFEVVDKKARLWTIQDARDGDVLVEDSCIFIIQKLEDNSTAAKTYCTLYNDGDFDEGSILYFDIDSTKPATKEQRDTLMKAMADAGYTFDFKRKESKKMEQYNITGIGSKHAEGKLAEKIKEMEQSKQNSAWSEKDEDMFQGVIETEQYMLDVVYGRKTFDVGNVSIKKECTKELAWLNSIKDRIK